MFDKALNKKNNGTDKDNLGVVKEEFEARHRRFENKKKEKYLLKSVANLDEAESGAVSQFPHYFTFCLNF